MLPKPESCRRCPLWGSGTGFVPDEMVPGAPVLFMFQNPGEQEEKGQRIVGYSGRDPLIEPCQPAPLLGKTGWDFTTKYLPLAGLVRGENVSVGNVLRCRWKKGNELPEARILKAAIEHCQKAHFRIPERTRLLVASGNPAKWALTGYGGPVAGVEEWRGWLGRYAPPWTGRELETTLYTPSREPSSLPVLIVLHLADLYRDPRMKVPTKADFRKIPRILKGLWPIPLPRIETLPQPEMWTQQPVAFDTEYDRHSRVLRRYSVCTKDYRLYVIEAEHHVEGYVPDDPVDLIGQNFCASQDLIHAERLGIRPGRLDDLMVMHASLWPGLPHDLNFLGSLYARINRWKHLDTTSPLVYAAGDAFGTMDTYWALRRELDRKGDPTYDEETRHLIDLIARRSSSRMGMAVDTARAKALAATLEAELEGLTLDAAALVGYPIQLSSNQEVAHHLYAIQGIKPHGRASSRSR